MRVSALVGAVAATAVAAAALAHAAVRPTPAFRTPGSAAYCSLEATSQEDWSPELFCWTPNDGWAVWINWRARRARTGYFTRRPRVVHATGVLKGYRPRARLLSFGRRWTYRCADPRSFDSCPAPDGVVVFRCTSRRSGLTCTNTRRHGFWIGRYRGFRLF